MMQSLQVFLGLSCILNGSFAINNNRLLRIRPEFEDDHSRIRMMSDMETFGNTDASDYVSEIFGRFLTEGSMQMSTPTSMSMMMSTSMHSGSETSSNNGGDSSNIGGSGGAKEAPPTPAPKPPAPTPATVGTPGNDSNSDLNMPGNDTDPDEEERENDNNTDETGQGINNAQPETPATDSDGDATEPDTPDGDTDGDETDTDSPKDGSVGNETVPVSPDIDAPPEVIDVCGMSTRDYETSISDIVASMASSYGLSNFETAQFRSLQWIVHHDGAEICPDDAERVVQRYVMGVLYYELGGREWKNCRAEGDGGECDSVRFLSDNHECEWSGVACEDGVITEIKQNANDLEGTLPDELYRLTSLKKLLLEGNNISGPITSGIQDLTSLEAIDLDNNQMSGNLPAELFGLETLQVIDLNDNEFYGELSAEISGLTNLVVLMLENNNFEGAIPSASLADLENLVTLQLHGNNFEGNVDEICTIIPARRDEYELYLRFFTVDCSGDSPKVECSCDACGCPSS
mmetsp:Transcript_23946/g.33627  ORF Transcript_23946/g.33627 Transcript_23946/m.33627 type:complete len:517 (-) Transcript_23946:217-1767(-)